MKTPIINSVSPDPAQPGVYNVDTSLGQLQVVFWENYAHIETYSLASGRAAEKRRVTINGVAYDLSIDLYRTVKQEDSEDYQPSRLYLHDEGNGNVWASGSWSDYSKEWRSSYSLRLRRSGTWNDSASDSANKQARCLVSLVFGAVLSAYPLAPMYGKLRALRDDAARKQRTVNEKTKELDSLIAEHTQIMDRIADAQAQIISAERA